MEIGEDAGTTVSRDRDAEIRVSLDSGIAAGYDFESMAAVANVYRTATAVRNRIEHEVLAGHQLSWGGFTALFVLWVWGPLESYQLANECGLAKGTLTGLVKKHEAAGLVWRKRRQDDRRRVEVGLTRRGTRKMEKVYPEFNRIESAVTVDLKLPEKQLLTELLVRVRQRAEPGRD